METTRSNSPVRTLLSLTLLALCHALPLGAQGVGISRKIVPGNGMDSLYIIAGVLTFGIIAYLLYLVIEKNRKGDKAAGPRRPLSQQRHHQHRIVKKSA